MVSIDLERRNDRRELQSSFCRVALATTAGLLCGHLFYD